MLKPTKDDIGARMGKELKRATAFFVAAITILLLLLVATGGTSSLVTGMAAIQVGLPFAAFPVAGISIVGFIVCASVAAVQIAAGVLSIAIWLAVCGAAVFAPPMFGLASSIGIREGWGDTAAEVGLRNETQHLLNARMVVVGFRASTDTRPTR